MTCELVTPSGPFYVPTVSMTCECDNCAADRHELAARLARILNRSPRRITRATPATALRTMTAG